MADFTARVTDDYLGCWRGRRRGALGPEVRPDRDGGGGGGAREHSATGREWRGDRKLSRRGICESLHVGEIERCIVEDNRGRMGEKQVADGDKAAYGNKDRTCGLASFLCFASVTHD